MHYTGPVYRPPFEADSILVQVTVGCSHNACTFCTMYRGTRFETSRMEDIEEDLREAARDFPSVKRVFLVNADYDVRRSSSDTSQAEFQLPVYDFVPIA